MKSTGYFSSTLIAVSAVALIFLPLMGCATTTAEKVTAEEYTLPQKTISAARALGADQLPQAKLYLGYAQNAVDTASKAIDQGAHRRAGLALARAQVDADLALTLAKESHLAGEVHQLNQQIEQLNWQLDH